MAKLCYIDKATAQRLFQEQAQEYDQQPIGEDGVLPATEASYSKTRITDPSRPSPAWWVHHESTDTEFFALLWVDPTLIYFNGHFPQSPILPGVTQVHWAVDAVNCLPGKAAGEYAGMSRVKFRKPVYPRTWLRMQLTKAAGKVDFSFHDGQDVCTQGRLLFHDA